MFNIDIYKQKMQATLDHFEAELRKVQTGRAQPSMLDSIKVEVYGSMMPLNQVANVNAPEPQLLQITPFDPGNIAAISAAIRNDQALSLNPSDDGRIIRVPVPSLTEERRKQLVKQASEKVEEARIGLRAARQDALQEAKRQKEAKALTEDDIKSTEKAIDRLVAEFQSKIDTIFRSKEQDIMKV
jgi:ribosome recycling factor